LAHNCNLGLELKVLGDVTHRERRGLLSKSSPRSGEEVHRHKGEKRGIAHWWEEGSGRGKNPKRGKKRMCLGRERLSQAGGMVVPLGFGGGDRVKRKAKTRWATPDLCLRRSSGLCRKLTKKKRMYRKIKKR